MRIEELYDRLVASALQRVRGGEVTERGLARMCGLSQPHIHNVLNHIRALSPGSADRLMSALGVTVAELLWGVSSTSRPEVSIVPIVRHRIGPGMECNLDIWRGSMPFSSKIIEPLVNPVVAQIGPDLLLPEALAAGDFVLLDRNPAACAQPRGRGCWIVQEHSGLRARYIRLGGTCIYLANQATVSDPRQWDARSLRSRDITEIVRARIVWIGRQMDYN